MMKSLLKKATSSLLALLVLLATTSISASTHYCGKHLVSFELNKTSKSCFGKYKFVIDGKASLKVSKKSCCKDLSVFKKGSNDVLKVQKDITFDKQKLSSKYFLPNLGHFESSFLAFTDVHGLNFRYRKNFKSIQDKTVLFQMFLI